MYVTPPLLLLLFVRKYFQTNRLRVLTRASIDFLLIFTTSNTPILVYKQKFSIQEKLDMVQWQDV